MDMIIIMTELENLTNFIKYVLLGIVQGLTEVLPISSSGHVAIVQSLLKIDTDQGILFFILINLGSLIAVLIHFRKIIFRLVKNFVLYIFKPSTREATKADYLYCWNIVIASIPIGLSGFFLASSINSIYADHRLVIVGVGLLITATLLYIVRNASFVNGRQEITVRDAIMIGIGQMFAPIPGLSRSGITTSTGLMRKLSMETVLVFSFMLYIPVSLGSFAKYFIEWAASPSTFDLGFNISDTWSYFYYLAATIFSFFATLFSLKYIFVWFRRGKLVYFSIYTFVLGIIALIAGVLII